MFIHDSKSLKDNILRKLNSKHPEILKYIDDPIIEELIKGLVDAISSEVYELFSNCVKEDDLRRAFR